MNKSKAWRPGHPSIGSGAAPVLLRKKRKFLQMRGKFPPISIAEILGRYNRGSLPRIYQLPLFS
jgi:hypothetical protein